MLPENAASRGRRYLVEGRLHVRRADEHRILARCRGDSEAVYAVGYEREREGWFCTCPAKRRCSHMVALQLVALEPDYL
jgi:uncharacterized Zn finger protein